MALTILFFSEKHQAKESPTSSLPVAQIGHPLFLTELNTNATDTESPPSYYSSPLKNLLTKAGGLFLLKGSLSFPMFLTWLVLF